MPYGTVGFEQALVNIHIIVCQQRVKFSSITTAKGYERLNGRIQRLEAPRKGCAMWQGWKAKVLAGFTMGDEPTMLGFESENTTLLHQHKEDDEELV